jgi:hypothetical protein
MRRSDIAEGFKQLAATTRSPSQLDMIDQYLADVPTDLGQKILILLHYSGTAKSEAGSSVRSSADLGRVVSAE